MSASHGWQCCVIPHGSVVEKRLVQDIDVLARAGLFVDGFAHGFTQYSTKTDALNQAIAIGRINIIERIHNSDHWCRMEVSCVNCCVSILVMPL